MVVIIGGCVLGKSSYIVVLINCFENEVGKNFNVGLMVDSDCIWNCYKNDFYKFIFIEKRMLGGIVIVERNFDVKKLMIFRMIFDN